MDLELFCRNIELPVEAVKVLLQVSLSEQEYRDEKQLYQTSRREWIHRVLCREDAKDLFLYLFCRFACDAHLIYQELKINDSVYWSTFSDIKIWCDNCCLNYGGYGLMEYEWLSKHVDLKLFRLGRLQFELGESEVSYKKDGVCLFKGQPVLYVHIPQGEALNERACTISLQAADQFFMNKKPQLPKVCHSWLLYPGLKELLPPDSNIIKFQNRFLVIRVDYEEAEAEERIFRHLKADPADYPEQSSLQKKAKQYLCSGNRLGNGFGIETSH